MSYHQEYFWQGQPVEVEFGSCSVEENDDKVLYWSNFEVSLTSIGKARIYAVKVTHKDGAFCISNQFGVGVYKLLNGGWPGLPHAALPLETFEPGLSPISFDEDAYKKNQKARHAYFEKTFPVEFKRMQALGKLCTP